VEIMKVNNEIFVEMEIFNEIFEDINFMIII